MRISDVPACLIRRDPPADDNRAATDTQAALRDSRPAVRAIRTMLRNLGGTAAPSLTALPGSAGIAQRCGWRCEMHVLVIADKDAKTEPSRDLQAKVIALLREKGNALEWQRGQPLPLDVSSKSTRESRQLSRCRAAMGTRVL